MPRPRPSQIYRSRPSPKYNLPEGFIISNCANHCPYCHKRLNGPFAVSGHLAYCVTARNSFKGDEVINIINDDDSYLQLLDADDDEGAIDIDIVDYNAYKLIQLHCLSKEKIECIRRQFEVEKYVRRQQHGVDWICSRCHGYECVD
jgi:hypothetical protein